MATPARFDDAHEPHRSGAQTVERAISLLNCFRDGAHDLGISEMGRITGLNVSTAHRIARVLCHEMFLEQDPRTDRYRLGPALALLGQRAMESSGFAVVLPILERLAADTGESATLGVRRRDEVVVMLRASSPQALRFDHPEGGTIHLHASGMGKALLAFSHLTTGEAAAALPDLPGFTPNTLTDRVELTAELDRIRVDGFAVNREERHVGVRGVGVPVLDRTRTAIAAVGVQGPAIRLTDERIGQILPALRQAGLDVAAVLSGR